MQKNNAFIFSMAFLIVGTSIGAGILGLPLETGLAGFFPSLISLISVWALMTITGWIFIYKLNYSTKDFDDFATLYEIELGTWAKIVNTIAYFLTFYGLLVAYLSGMSTTIASIFPRINSFPFSNAIISILFFILATSLILFGIEIVRKTNTLFTILLFTFFILLVILILKHIDVKLFEYTDWKRIPIELPILATAFGYHPVIPIINSNVRNKNLTPKSVLKILFYGTTIVLIINLLWVSVVMGVLPLNSPDNNSITGAIRQGVPATVPVARLINSKILITFATLFTFFAIITSYLGVGTGFLNYIKGLTSNLFKRNKFTDSLIVFTIPLIITLTYPNLFITMLNIVGGLGVITAFGILPGFMAVKKENPTYIRIFGLISIVLSVFYIYYRVYINRCKLSGEESGGSDSLQNC